VAGAPGPASRARRPPCPAVQHRDRAVGRHRIGGIGLDQHDRRLPAHQIAVEAGWKGDDELHLAAIEQAVSLTLVDTADDLEVIAVLHRRDVGTSKRARIGHDDGGRQMLGIGIDRVAEKHQLHDRDADDHAEGQPVAFELDELLEQDAEPAGKEKGWEKRVIVEPSTHHPCRRN
jgi:hypothetical protein